MQDGHSSLLFQRAASSGPRSSLSLLAHTVIPVEFSLLIPCILHSCPPFLIPWLVPACNLLISTIMSVAVIRSASPCRRLKVGLAKSWRRPIPCRSAPDRWFYLCSHAGRTFKPFVSAASSGPRSPLAHTVIFANIDPQISTLFLIPHF
jgi:hypothetical protein